MSVVAELYVSVLILEVIRLFVHQEDAVDVEDFNYFFTRYRIDALGRIGCLGIFLAVGHF